MQQQGFFEAASGVAGTLIGLLFVAMSMARERLAEWEETQVHRVVGAAAFVAFVNALCVSLMALIPGNKAGWSALAVSVVGFVFVVASGLALVLDRGVLWRDLPHLLFLFILSAVFIVQFLSGLRLVSDGDDAQVLSTLSTLVVTCFLVGIARAWELVGGPSVSPWHHLAEMLRPLAKLSRKQYTAERR